MFSIILKDLMVGTSETLYTFNTFEETMEKYVTEEYLYEVSEFDKSGMVGSTSAIIVDVNGVDVTPEDTKDNWSVMYHG
jgi:hypothetical protein